MSAGLFFILAIARAVDLLTTYARDPYLRRELNPLVRFLGWRNNILLNLSLVMVSPVLPLKFVLALIFLSLGAGIWNTIGIIRDAYRIRP